jgi:hypothetical protein
VTVTIFLNGALSTYFMGLAFPSGALRTRYAEDCIVEQLIAIEILQLILLVCISCRPDVLRMSLVTTRRNYPSGSNR